MYNAAVPLRKVAPIEPDARILKSVSALYKLAKLRFNEKPRLLDYGSGFGRWAKAAIQVGFDVVAYEPSAERGKKSGELLTYRVVANITDLRGEKFHVFNFEQVLEHTPDPLVVLSNIYPLSTKNSIIRVTVPNIEKESDDIWNSFPFDGERMHVLSPYEHLQGFCPSSLERLLFRAKMKYLKNSDVLITHPQYLLRRSLQNYISSIGQTMAIVSWPSYP